MDVQLATACRAVSHIHKLAAIRRPARKGIAGIGKAVGHGMREQIDKHNLTVSIEQQRIAPIDRDSRCPGFKLLRIEPGDAPRLGVIPINYPDAVLGWISIRRVVASEYEQRLVGTEGEEAQRSHGNRQHLGRLADFLTDDLIVARRVKERAAMRRPLFKAGGCFECRHTGQIVEPDHLYILQAKEQRKAAVRGELDFAETVAERALDDTDLGACLHGRDGDGGILQQHRRCGLGAAADFGFGGAHEDRILGNGRLRQAGAVLCAPVTRHATDGGCFRTRISDRINRRDRVEVGCAIAQRCVVQAGRCRLRNDRVRAALGQCPTHDIANRWRTGSGLPGHIECPTQRIGHNAQVFRHAGALLVDAEHDFVGGRPGVVESVVANNDIMMLAIGQRGVDMAARHGSRDRCNRAAIADQLVVIDIRRSACSPVQGRIGSGHVATEHYRIRASGITDIGDCLIRWVAGEGITVVGNNSIVIATIGQRIAERGRDQQILLGDHHVGQLQVAVGCHCLVAMHDQAHAIRAIDTCGNQ